MPPQNSKTPKSAFSQSLGRFLAKTVERLGEWQAQQREAEKRAVANAKFPWLEALWLLTLHICLGLTLTMLPGDWAIAAWVLVIGVSLYCTLVAVCIDGSLLPDSFICSMAWSVIALPWISMHEKLDLVLRRWILHRFRDALAIDFWKAIASIFCLVALLGLSGLGLRLGHWLATQFW